MITLRSHEELRKLEEASRVVLETLDVVEKAVRPGVTTLELDRIAEEEIRRRGARPAFLGYRGFPRTLCTSVNDEVVHGIPGNRVFERRGRGRGRLRGRRRGVLRRRGAHAGRSGASTRSGHGCCASPAEALEAGIAAARPGGRVSDIGAAIEALAFTQGYGVVRDFVGHGVGTALHEEPQIPNYGPAGRGSTLKAGMVIAIEPMFNLGGPRVKVDDDGWTVRTADGSASAHFEYTVALLPEGAVVLGTGRVPELQAAVGA